MVVRIKKTTKKEEIDKLLKKLKTKRKKVNLDKYFGKINFGMDGLTYQKKIRNEWR